MLRRQVHCAYRRPLIVMTPKSMLRNKTVVSPLADFTDGTRFHEVLDDPALVRARESDGDGRQVRRIILCSGKIYWELAEQRDKDSAPVAIIRLEQFYPFPADMLVRILNQYAHAHDDVVWVQEESHNMGGWFFVEPRMRLLGFDIQYVGRDDSASPATGLLEIHKREQREIVRTALHGKAPHMVASYQPSDFSGNLAPAANEKVKV
jgi:2-oxoglutarate dehydrogenase E1 component